MTAGLRRRLDARTQPFRERYASQLFLHGRARVLDATVTAAYFLLDSPSWESFAHRDNHLAAFMDGLEHCREPRTAIDLGMGAGHSTALLARRFPRCQVTGVDLSPAMVRRARHLHTAPLLRFRWAPSQRLPFPDGYGDLVVALNAVPELTELARVCRLGAQVLMASTFDPLREPDSLWRRRWHEAGFVLSASGTSASGSWELFAAPSG